MMAPRARASSVTRCPCGPPAQSPVELDADHEAAPADLADGGQRLDVLGEQLAEEVDLGCQALERVLLLEDVERRQRRRAGQRVARVGVAVEEGAELLVAAEEALVDALGGERGGERAGSRRSGPSPTHMRSGVTPSCSQANIVPVRPKPVATSSQIRSTPNSSHSARTARR